MVKSQLSVRMGTCECVEAQEDWAGHPLLVGRGTDHASDFEFDGESGKVCGGPWSGGKRSNGGLGGARIGTWFIGEPDGRRLLTPAGEERMHQVVAQQYHQTRAHTRWGERLVPSQGAWVANLAQCWEAAHYHRQQQLYAIMHVCISGR